MFTIQKLVRLRDFKSRLHIKAFKYSDDMHKFLNKQPNNDWQVSQHQFKSGIYAYAGGVYHNVKDLDAIVLAHI